MKESSRRDVLIGSVECGDEGGGIAGGDGAELAGRFATETTTGDLIEVQRAVAFLIDKDAGDLRAVEAFDQAAVEVEALDAACAELAEQLGAAGAVVPDVAGNGRVLGQFASGLVGAAEIQLEGQRGRRLIGHRLDHIGTEESLGHGAGQWVAEQHFAKEVFALLGPWRSREAEGQSKAIQALAVAGSGVIDVVALVEQEQRALWVGV